MKYDPLTNRYATWLFQYIDRYDFGVTNKKSGTVTQVNENWKLEGFYQSSPGIFPQKLTRTLLDKHLTGTEKIHVIPSRSTGFALMCIDIDAHEGQQDAYEAACWARSTYFPHCYLEPSRRGYHLYLLCRVGHCPRWHWNHIVAHVEVALQSLFVENAFESTVEVRSSFSLVHDGTIEHGRFAAAPCLPNRQSDLNQLERMPVYLPRAFKQLHLDGELSRELAEELYVDHQQSGPEPEGQTTVPDGYVSWKSNAMPHSPCAWDRMKRACFDYTTIYRQIPTPDELLEHYRTTYDTNEGDHRRIKRAKQAIKYRQKTFDPSKAGDGGFKAILPELLKAIQTHATNRTTKYTSELTDEDFAVALYTITIDSFTKHDDSRRQWTVGTNSIMVMFRTLSEAKAIDRGCNRNKATALKQILEAAGLIECIDRKWVSTKDGTGICKKWTIGTNHPRYAEFVRFAEEITVTYVNQLKPKTTTVITAESCESTDAWHMVA